MERLNLRVLARFAAIVVLTCLCPTKTQAGDSRAFLFDANYAKPLRWNVGASLFFPTLSAMREAEVPSSAEVLERAGCRHGEAWRCCRMWAVAMFELWSLEHGTSHGALPPTLLM